MVRENFCGICAVVPMALAGAGVAGLAGSKEDYKRNRRIKLAVGAIVVLFTLVMLYKYGDCAQCK